MPIRTTLVTRLFLAAGLALPAVHTAWSPVQDPDDQDEVGREEPPAKGEKKDDLERDLFGRVVTRQKREAFEGAWQLLNLRAEGYPPEGLQPTGYLLISQGFLAFEMHVSYDSHSDVEEYEDGFQTFMAEYSLVGGSHLQCRTLIGSYLEEGEEELVWEPAGYGRTFEVDLAAGFLTLTWDDGDSMTFGRRKHGMSGRENIFGRVENVPSVTRGVDIFGRRGAPPKGGEEGDDGE